MTRPSRNTDRLLLDAGKKLLPKTGISGLRVRDLAKKAGVNPGMFTYHFDTKERFIERLLSEVYEDFFKDFSIEAKSGKNSREQLENAVFTAARFVRDNRALIGVLAEDIFLGNRAIMGFAKKNMTRHVEILFNLLRRCQKEGHISGMPIFNILPILFGAVIAPGVLLRVAEKHAGGGIIPALFLKTLRGELLSDTAIRQRIDIALKGLSPACAK